MKNVKNANAYSTGESWLYGGKNITPAPTNRRRGREQSGKQQQPLREMISQARSTNHSTFSGVAAALNFVHHIGTDTKLELAVLKKIMNREGLLERLEELASNLRKEIPAGPEVPVDSGILELLSVVREATVSVIGAVSRWRESVTVYPPPGFMWHGENYLLKIANDLNFLAGVDFLVKSLKVHPATLCRNPLMLPQTLDEQRLKPPAFNSIIGDSSSKTPTGSDAERSRLTVAAQVLIEEESLEIEREAMVREGRTPQPIGQAGAKQNGTGVVFDVQKQQIDQEQELQQQKILNWYSAARDQLLALSANTSDEQFYQSSRRFWEPQELDKRRGAGGGILPIRKRGPAAGYGPVAQRLPQPSLVLRTSQSEGNVGPPSVKRKNGAPQSKAVVGGNRGVIKPGRSSSVAQLPNMQHSESNGTCSYTNLISTITAADLEEITTSCVEGTEAGRLASLVASAVAILLSPADSMPSNNLMVWPGGFQELCSQPDAAALLQRLISGDPPYTPVPSDKARAVKPLLQNVDMTPAALLVSAGKTVAALAAWCLEALRTCPEEFREWSKGALKDPTSSKAAAMKTKPEANGIGGRRRSSISSVTKDRVQIYKGKAVLQDRQSYIITVFQRKDGSLSLSAFDTLARSAVAGTLSVPKEKVDAACRNQSLDRYITVVLLKQLTVSKDALMLKVALGPRKSTTSPATTSFVGSRGMKTTPSTVPLPPRTAPAATGRRSAPPSPAKFPSVAPASSRRPPGTSNSISRRTAPSPQRPTSRSLAASPERSKPKPAALPPAPKQRPTSTPVHAPPSPSKPKRPVPTVAPSVVKPSVVAAPRASATGGAPAAKNVVQEPAKRKSSVPSYAASTAVRRSSASSASGAADVAIKGAHAAGAIRPQRKSSSSSGAVVVARTSTADVKRDSTSSLSRKRSSGSVSSDVVSDVACKNDRKASSGAAAKETVEVVLENKDIKVDVEEKAVVASTAGDDDFEYDFEEPESKVMVEPDRKAVEPDIKPAGVVAPAVVSIDDDFEKEDLAEGNADSEVKVASVASAPAVVVDSVESIVDDFEPEEEPMAAEPEKKESSIIDDFEPDEDLPAPAPESAPVEKEIDEFEDEEFEKEEQSIVNASPPPPVVDEVVEPAAPSVQKVIAVVESSDYPEDDEFDSAPVEVASIPVEPVGASPQRVIAVVESSDYVDDDFDETPVIPKVTTQPSEDLVVDKNKQTYAPEPQDDEFEEFQDEEVDSEPPVVSELEPAAPATEDDEFEFEIEEPEKPPPKRLSSKTKSKSADEFDNFSFDDDIPAVPAPPTADDEYSIDF